jgi:hypothetical protein
MHMIYSESERNNYDRKPNRVVNAPTFYLEGFGSDVNIWYPDKIHQSIQVTAGIAPETRQRITPCTSFPIYDSLNLLNVDMFRQPLFGMCLVRILTNTQAVPIETLCGLSQTSQKIIRLCTSNISCQIPSVLE